MNANRLGETNFECDKTYRVEEVFVSYGMAIITIRERYLEDRLPGESAKEWLNRMYQQS